MANQIVLAWTVSVAGTSYGAAKAATALGAVALYQNATTDPVLGQLFGLTVAGDVITTGGSSATRTLTLNMTRVPGAPFAPPPFPCHPDTTTPPVLPYVLRKAVPLPGFSTVITGSTTVGTSLTLKPSLKNGDTVQFLAQLGVFYTVNTVGAASFTLTAPYTGVTAPGSVAVVMKKDPVVRPAVFSTSPLDQAGFATIPAIPAGSGARTISLTYFDSLGAGPFTVTANLTGRRPAAITLNGGSIDVATITQFHIASAGAFSNSVGQITLVDLASALPTVITDATPIDFLGRLTDEAQLLIARSAAYIPPSYFALAGQDAAAPTLDGDFFVTTGSAGVTTSADQTSALAPGDTVRFASQDDAAYTIDTVSAGLLALTTPYTGLNAVLKRDANGDKRSNDFTARADKQATSAFPVKAAAATNPTNTQLAGLLAEFVNPGNAVPPPDAPLLPGTMTPAPTFLSGMFARTIQLALAGVPVVKTTVAFV